MYDFYVTYDNDQNFPETTYTLPDGRKFKILVYRSPEDNGIVIEVATPGIEPTEEKMRIWLNEECVEDNR